MTLKEFLRPTKKILIIFIILFLLNLTILSILTRDSPIEVLKVTIFEADAYEFKSEYLCTKGGDCDASTDYFIPRVGYTILVLLGLYIISCIINYFILKKKQ
jgi:hypothetical protein